MDLSALSPGPELRGVESSFCVGNSIVCCKDSPSCNQNVGVGDANIIM